MQQSTNKISYLDGIRGLAAFIVFIHHFAIAFYPAYYSLEPAAAHMGKWEMEYGRSLYSVLTNGNFCVCVFFVLSGFVLSRKYFRAADISVLVSGAQRRFIRLYVPVAVTIVISYLLIKAHLFYNTPVSHIAHSEWWFERMWTFEHPTRRMFQCLAYNTMFFGDAAFDTTFWTIAIELFGSLFVFAFLALTHNTRNRLAALGFMLFYFYYAQSLYFAAFVFGISLNYSEVFSARMQLQPGSSKKMTAISAVLCLVGLVMGSYPSTNVYKGTFFARLTSDFFIYVNWLWFHVIGAWLLVLAFVVSPVFQRGISVRPLRFLGYVSFCLYLLHPLVIGSIGSYLFLQCYKGMGYNPAVALVFSVSTFVCLLLSWLMTKYVDGPGIKLAKYIYDRYVKPLNKKAEVG